MDNKERQKGLVIIDVINGFVSEGVFKNPYAETIVDEVERLANGFIKNGHKVIATVEAHEMGCAEFNVHPVHCLKGTHEADLIDPLKKLESKMTVIAKNNNSAVFAPGFVEAVKDLDEIVVVGLCTDICVMDTVIPLSKYFAENNKDVKLTVPENAVETFHIPGVHDRDEWNKMAFRFMKQAGIEVVKGIEFDELGKRKNLKGGMQHGQGERTCDINGTVPK